MTSLDHSLTTATTVAETVAPATVRIGRDGGRGLGVVVAPGAVLTNAHNLRGRQVTVTSTDGRTAVGEVRAVDPDGDLAVVSVETGDAPSVRWSDTHPVVGSPVWAVTMTPTGGTRVTTGAVSALDRPFRGPGGRLIAASVEHTAPLPRGASGGVIVAADGSVVGLNTHRLGDGFYLALPADAELRARIDRLVDGRAPTRRRLGVALAPSEASRRLRAAVGLDERDGLLVRGVEDGSPAATAGLRRGDLIVSVAGRPVAGADELFAALGAEGDHLELGIVRGSEEITVSVDFAAAAAAAAAATEATEATAEAAPDAATGAEPGGGPED